MIDNSKKLGRVLLISQGNLPKNLLKDEVAIVTGAGRGIGYEAARALLWLGARVVIAEINEKNGRAAAEVLTKEFGEDKAIFLKTDIGNDKDVEKITKEVQKKWGKVDIILNNATVFPMGAVKDTTVEKWDFSYRVNLRGPVLLARTFLSGMIRRKHGVFVCVSSSGAAPFMGPYEVFKTAQGELASTIAAELEGTGVYAFTIGPGIVKTEAFMEGGAQVASMLGIKLEELLEMNKSFEISPEAAGVGFAASIALATNYHGQETSSIQVLREIGIILGDEAKPQNTQTKPIQTSETTTNQNAADLYERVMKTYVEQSEGWKRRNLFERQWVARDFKKTTGISTDEMLSALINVGRNLQNPQAKQNSIEILQKLAGYFEHQQDQLKGFEKNPQKLQENLKIMDTWIQDIKNLTSNLAR
jgi:NAD(P)-dependent dehydrogenase (short-subunit alcohol dehydrogenase family)